MNTKLTTLLAVLLLACTMQVRGAQPRVNGVTVAQAQNGTTTNLTETSTLTIGSTGSAGNSKYYDSLGNVTVEIDGIFGTFSLSDSGYANSLVATQAVTAGSATITTNVTIGSGDNFGIQTTISEGQLMDIRRGTMANPIITSNGPAIRATQTLEIPSSVTTGDGSDFAAAIQGLSQGTVADEIQPIGVYGGSKSYGGADALGGYFLGRAYSNSVGIGLTAYAMREQTNGYAHGIENVVFNNSGVNSSWTSTGVAKDVNLLQAPGGNADQVAAIQWHNSRGVQWQYGLGIGGNTVSNKVGAVRDASIHDDGHALVSLEISGKHTNAAIAIDNVAGYVLIGETSASFPQQRLSVISSNGYSADPLVFIGHPGFSSNYSTFIRNSSGTLRLGIAGTTNFTITGTSPGDSIITPSTGKSLHLGGTTKVISVSQAGALDLLASTYAFGRVLTPWPNTDNTVTLIWRKSPQVFEFAGSNAAEWSTVIANSGSQSFGQADDGNDTGQALITTGTLTNGVGGYRLATTSTRFGTTSKALHWRIQTSALSTDVEGYEIYSGFGDNNTSDAAPVDGAYIFYSHGTSTSWIGKTANNSTPTTATGGGTMTVVANTWYDFLIDGTSTAVNFWASNDEGATWTYLGTSASNIPSGSGRETGIETYIRKIGGSVGTAARTVQLGRCAIYSN